MFKAGAYYYLLHNCSNEPQGAVYGQQPPLRGDGGYWYWTVVSRATNPQGPWTDWWCDFAGDFYSNSRPVGSFDTAYYGAYPNMRDITTIFFADGKWHLFEHLLNPSGTQDWRVYHCTNPSTNPDVFPTTGWLYPTANTPMMSIADYTGDLLDPDTGTPTNGWIYPDVRRNPAGGWVAFVHIYNASGRNRIAVTLTSPTLDGPWSVGSKIIGTYDSYYVECAHYFADGTYHYLTVNYGLKGDAGCIRSALWRADSILGPYTEVMRPLIPTQSWGTQYVGPSCVINNGDGTAIGMFYANSPDWIKKIGTFTLSGLEVAKSITPPLAIRYRSAGAWQDCATHIRTAGVWS